MPGHMSQLGMLVAIHLDLRTDSMSSLCSVQFRLVSARRPWPFIRLCCLLDLRVLSTVVSKLFQALHCQATCGPFVH